MESRPFFIGRLGDPAPFGEHFRFVPVFDPSVAAGAFIPSQGIEISDPDRFQVGPPEIVEFEFLIGPASQTGNMIMPPVGHIELVPDIALRNGRCRGQDGDAVPVCLGPFHGQGEGVRLPGCLSGKLIDLIAEKVFDRIRRHAGGRVGADQIQRHAVEGVGLELEIVVTARFVFCQFRAVVDDHLEPLFRDPLCQGIRGQCEEGRAGILIDDVGDHEKDDRRFRRLGPEAEDDPAVGVEGLQRPFGVGGQGDPVRAGIVGEALAEDELFFRPFPDIRRRLGPVE